MTKSSSHGADIPADVLDRWQELVDLLARIIEVPAAVVVKIHLTDAEVFVTSNSRGNPFGRGDIYELAGLYCERVIQTRQLLQVPNALLDEGWKSSPDVKVGMISYLGFPILWPSGEVFGTICVLDSKTNEYNDLYRQLLIYCRDILQGDLGQLENLSGELANQRTLLDELFARAPVAIALVGYDSIVRRINPEFTNIFGYSEEETVGQSLIDLIAPDNLRAEVEANRDRVIVNGEVYSLDVVRRRKDGSLIPLAHMGVPVGPPGKRNLAYAIFRDISDQKRLENELRHERDRLRLLLEITNSITSRLDLRQLLDALSTDLLAVMRCDFCALLLPDDASSDKLRTAVLYNPDARGVLGDGSIVRVDESLPGMVFRTGKSKRVDSFLELRNSSEAQGNPHLSTFCDGLLAEGLRSGCFLPLAGRNRVVGVLAALNRANYSFATADVSFLEQVARQIAIAVENAFEYRKAADDRDKEAEEKRYLQEEIRTDRNSGEFIGQSPALKVTLQQVSVVAPTDSTVLILGETGTGKELIARAIHDLSPRRERPFVKLNCAAIPLGLLESELFGHERGAFTGAVAQKKGRFELADKGTLFLDEVGDIPLELQPKLLRVLQEQEFERLGGTRTHKVDVRIIAATHRDLATMVKHCAFREDLYYRLKVFPVHIPPLRERKEDIPLLALHFVRHYARRMGKSIDGIPARTLDALVRYRWPGNVRELQNFMERAVILSPDNTLQAPIMELEASTPVPISPQSGSALNRLEREHILLALEQSNWVVGGPGGAAAKLGLKRTSLVYKMQRLGISRDDGRG